jgi:SPFH domain / Band 7 family
MKRADHFNGRTRVCLLTLTLFLAASLPTWSETSSSRQAQKKVELSPKCAFLRSEVRRIAKEGQDFLDNSQLASVTNLDELTAVNGTISDWAAFVSTSEVFVARRAVVGLEFAACERGVALSDTTRLGEIERTRAAQIKRATQRWQISAGEQGKDFEGGLAAQINAVYEAETKSFYNQTGYKFEDRDIGKDYSDLPSLIQNSALDQGTKDFYGKSLSFLRYEEAGRLANALRGLDKEQGLNYAYVLRKALADRVAVATTQSARVKNAQMQEWRRGMINYSLLGIAAIVILALLWLWIDRTQAKYRAFRTSLKRSPFWMGNAEWIFWDPGETVVLLEHKRLVPMMDPQGGYCAISAWKGQEYKGRISYKTQFSTWKSDPILTSDGLAVNLGVGIWWKITNASIYVSAIASDYHEGEQHRNENLGEAAEFWIKKLAAGTLREEVNQLPAEKLISPYVQAYLQVRRGPEGELLPQGSALPNFSEQLGKAEQKLNEKTLRYGIEIERLEVQELILPPVYQQKLEAVRVAFLEPSQARAMTEAQVIALRGLASVIGEDKVGLIEVLKHVDLSHVGMNPFTGVIPIVQPVVDSLQQRTAKALPPESNRSPSLPAGPDEPKRLE